MKQTPNIGLTEIGSSYIDKDIDLEEWRLLIAGEDSSNMSIIDKEVGDLKKIIKKDGTGQKYLSDDGTYRYVSGGGGLSKIAFASDNYLVYTSTSDTTTFTISDMSTSKSVELIKDNLVMMQGQDYDIDKSTGVVTLSYTLNNGEKIYYNVVEGEEKAILYSDDSEIEPNREKYLTDINGNFIAPKTTIAAVDGLSENVSGQITSHNDNTSSHTDIREQINDLIQHISLTGQNIDTLSGNYYAEGFVADNPNLPSVWCYVEGRKLNNSRERQTYRTLATSGIILERWKIGDTWGGWVPIATTTKTSFSLDAGAGYTILSQNCYIQNGLTYINLSVKRTDDTVFPIGSLYVAYSSSLPSIISPISSVSYITAILNTPIATSVPTILASKNILVINSLSNIKSMLISSFIG